MKLSTKDTLRNVSRLLRFITLYAVAVAMLFVVMPAAGARIEAGYESLSGTLRIVIVSAFFLVVAVWQIVRQRDRMRNELKQYGRPRDRAFTYSDPAA
jgi:uncharacterized membrane protein YozB (DUF420 family)